MPCFEAAGNPPLLLAEVFLANPDFGWKLKMAGEAEASSVAAHHTLLLELKHLVQLPLARTLEMEVRL
jgi:hypothetical protein